jgi:hypothetical protein
MHTAMSASSSQPPVAVPPPLVVPPVLTAPFAPGVPPALIVPPVLAAPSTAGTPPALIVPPALVAPSGLVRPMPLLLLLQAIKPTLANVARTTASPFLCHIGASMNDLSFCIIKGSKCISELGLFGS